MFGLSSSPFCVEMVFILGKEKTLEGKRKIPLSLQGLMLCLFFFMLVQRKPNFDIGEKWFPARHSIFPCFSILPHIYIGAQLVCANLRTVFNLIILI